MAQISLNFTLARDQAGFSFLGVILLVAILGATLPAVSHFWQAAQLREKEKDLLFVGHEYRRAIERYYLATPGSVKQYPRELRDLVLDPRQQTVQRHLRKLYRDPVTNKAEWGLVKNPDGSIRGVYSLSEDSPMKIANFAKADATFTNNKKYSDWKFVYQTTQQGGQQVPLANQPPSQGNQPATQGAQGTQSSLQGNQPASQGTQAAPQGNPFSRQ